MDGEGDMTDEIEDDEIIVLEGDNQDIVDNEMLQYFGGANNQKKPPIDVDLEGVCRICLGEEDGPETNPLFSPCRCAGSIGLIHLECLREWLMSKKIQRLGEIVSTYFWKNLECELCKERFPIEIELKNKSKVNVLNYDLPAYEADE